MLRLEIYEKYNSSLGRGQASIVKVLSSVFNHSNVVKRVHLEKVASVLEKVVLQGRDMERGRAETFGREGRVIPFPAFRVDFEQKKAVEDVYKSSMTEAPLLAQQPHAHVTDFPCHNCKGRMSDNSTDNTCLMDKDISSKESNLKMLRDDVARILARIAELDNTNQKKKFKNVVQKVYLLLKDLMKKI